MPEKGPTRDTAPAWGGERRCIEQRKDMADVRVLLVRPGFEGDYPQSLYPWLGAGYLSSYLKKHMDGRLELALADEPAGDDVLAVASKWKPDLIGVTSTTLEFGRASRLASALKRETRVPILMGGVHMTGLPESLPADCDMGVHGEGEVVFLNLLRHLEHEGRFDGEFLAAEPGVFVHGNGAVAGTPGNRSIIKDLDDVPMPDRSVISERYYEPQYHAPGHFGRGTSIFTSRGCLFNCIYCGGGAFWPKPVRYHSSRRVVEEITYLVDAYGVEYINILDDLFHFSKRRLREIVELIRARGLHERVRFGCQANASLMDEETAELLRRMNVVYAGFGFETGSDRILSLLKHQKASVRKHAQVLAWCRERGMMAGSGFMIGNPTETAEDLQQTYEFVLSHPMDSCNVYYTIPFPGTTLWDTAKSQGAVTADMDWNRFNQFYHGDDFINCSEVSGEELIRWKRRIAAACDLTMLRAYQGGWAGRLKFLLYLLLKKDALAIVRALLDRMKGAREAARREKA